MRVAKSGESGEQRSDVSTVLILAVLVSLFSFLYYFRHNQVLLYGDAVAHINIARRVFDSLTPGWKQLGTVWLPLPHILIIPFVISNQSWHTGFGASFPFMIAYVAGMVGIFRLVRDGLAALTRPGNGPATPGTRPARLGDPHYLAAWFAAALYGVNPNLIYLQSTAMTESLYLALFIWALVFFSEFVRLVRANDSGREEQASRWLMWCGLFVAGAMLTRYDGWFLGSALAVISVAVVVGRGRLGKRESKEPRGLLVFLVLVAAAPAFWLAYNAAIYGNALDFVNGPYSARAIEQKTESRGEPHHPGYQNIRVATTYFIKSVELDIGEGNWSKFWLVLAAAGTLLAVSAIRSLSIWLLLWLPLPFYALSIAYGGVPVFVPTWWPFSYYNLRYGLQLLPAIAVFSAVTLYFLVTRVQSRRWKVAVPFTGFALLALSNALIWRAQPVCLREAIANSRTRIGFEKSLAKELVRLPPSSTLLMYIGDHGGALQDAGIPLGRVIQEGNHGDPRQWGKEGMWQRALQAPNRYADFAVAFDNDPVAKSAQEHHLPALVVIQTTGQPRATIYRTRQLIR
ncbi:MAG TPA: hypothetical protein VFA76_13310 [Terriglobales bacterium]|nr:hypothetical protein [Terriglobales bacterium]